MPPLTKNEIEEVYNKLLPAFEQLDATKQMSMPDGKKLETHAIASEAIKWRQKQSAESNKYSVKKFYGGRYFRIAPYYLDLAGTPEAKKKNEEFYESLETEEGCKAFANRVAKDLLNIKYEDFFFNGSIHEAVKKYAENPRIYELGYVAADLLTDDHGILDKDIYDAINDRKELFQILGNFNEFTSVASTKTFLVCDGLSNEKVQLKEEKSNYLEDGFNDYINDSPLAADFNKYCDSFNNLDVLYTKEVKEINETARKLSAYKMLDTYTLMKNAKGERVDIYNGIKKYNRGEKFTFENASHEVRESIDKLLGTPDVSKPIKMPRKNEDDKKAVYDAFGKEALTSRGRGLQQEFARLKTVMDGAKLWYTSGSPEYVNISKALKSFSESPIVPNTEQSKAAINEILTYCNKYIADKNGKELKDRELKRLNAVTAVSDSLKAKLGYLNNVSENALIERVLSGNEENQNNIFNNETSRLKAYKEQIEKISEEKGAAGILARSTDKTVEALTQYGENALINYEDREIFSKNNFRSNIARMAMLGMITQERRRQATAGKPDEKGKIENMLDTMFLTEKGIDKAVQSIAQTDTVKNLEKQIINSAEFTQRYLMTNGTDRLINDLNNELKAKYPEEKNPDTVNNVVTEKKQENPQKGNVLA